MEERDFGEYAEYRNELQKMAIDNPDLDLLRACRRVATKPPNRRKTT